MQIQPVTFAPHIEQFSDRHLQAIKDQGDALDLQAPYHVEIGSNRGRFLRGIARVFPHRSIIGLEIRPKWARLAGADLRKDGITHAASLYGDANLALPLLFPDASLERVYILFPDPWWKKRHARRRIISPHVLQLLAAKLQPGGLLIIKTDVEPYYHFAAGLFDDTCPQFRRLDPQDPAWPQDEPAWPLTTREVRIVEKGLPVFKLYAVRTDVPASPDAIREAALERFPKPDVTLDNPRANAPARREDDALHDDDDPSDDQD